MAFIVVVWLLSGALCAFIASQKNRNSLGWFLAGLFFGIFAIVGIIAVPALEGGAE